MHHGPARYSTTSFYLKRYPVAVRADDVNTNHGSNFMYSSSQLLHTDRGPGNHDNANQLGLFALLNYYLTFHMHKRCESFHYWYSCGRFSLLTLLLRS